jgi:hypothetical protein
MVGVLHWAEAGRVKKTTVAMSAKFSREERRMESSQICEVLAGRERRTTL